MAKSLQHCPTCGRMMDSRRSMCVFCQQQGAQFASHPRRKANADFTPLQAIGVVLATLAAIALLFGGVAVYDNIRSQIPAPAPSSEELCSAARTELARARDRRNDEMRAVAVAKDAGQDYSRLEANVAAYRRQVDDAARKARAIPGCNIDDLAGPMVGR